jgi:hypothetical protein
MLTTRAPRSVAGPAERNNSDLLTAWLHPGVPDGPRHGTAGGPL